MRNRLLVPTLGDHGFQLDEPGPCLVGAAALIRQEELDRLAKSARDVLEGGQGRACPASLDQVDGRGCDTALAHLGETEAGFQTGLLHRPGTEVDSG